MALVISPRVREKLKNKHCVDEKEIVECFASRYGKYLIDTRENHRTDPPTLWFIAETNRGRRLKVVFIQRDDHIEIKTAYDPNAEEMRIYMKYGARS